MKITLICISYNNNEIFKRSFMPLVENTSPNYELIEGDNNSSDKSYMKYFGQLS